MGLYTEDTPEQYQERINLERQRHDLSQEEQVINNEKEDKRNIERPKVNKGESNHQRYLSILNGIPRPSDQ